MTPTHDTLAHIRFGMGYGPRGPAVFPGDDLAAQARRPHPLEARYAPTDERIAYDLLERLRVMRQDTSPLGERETAQFLASIKDRIASDQISTIAIAAESDQGLRERLAFFWASHFAVSGKGLKLSFGAAALVHNAIRPHIGGRFADMLNAVVKHPAMLYYLDQYSAVGPNSVIGRMKSRRGLNENLAREVLELHALGVRGGFMQGDVQELAKLFTGMQFGEDGFEFALTKAEPGGKTVLGKTYGGLIPSENDIDGFIEDVALHPQTARHLARKLAIHFIGTHAPKDLTVHVAAAYSRSYGDLTATYRALLEHPTSWRGGLLKVKTPVHYIASTFRALGVKADIIVGLDAVERQRQVFQPLREMGQPLFRPQGPDGWPEDPEAWVTPPALAGRIEWARRISRHYGGARDPLLFAQNALGEDLLSPRLAALIGKAPSEDTGVALTLISPEFNRC